MDRFTELQAFVRTVERGSQSAAAREIGVTPAMVGRYLHALEARLGARLLNRTTQTQSLTEAGAAFYPRAAAALDALEEAERAASAARAEPHGLLRVAAPMSFGIRHLAAAVAEFCRLHPGVRVELSLNDRVVDLVDEGYDVAVRIGRLADSSLVARRLSPCRLAVCAAPSYLARRGLPAAPADLRAHDCLLYAYDGDGDTWRFRGEAGEVELSPAGPLRANNGDALLAAALVGQGVAMLPTFIAGDALRDGRLVRLLPGWGLREIAAHAVYPSARHLAPKVRGFVAFLAARFRDPAPWDEGLDDAAPARAASSS